jgi:hypothetical protein
VRALFLSPRDTISFPDFQWVSGSNARFVAYRRGVRVFFDTPDGDPPPRGDSATIMDQSDPSRRRAAFAFLTAECDWLAMTTLTYHADPPGGADDVVKHQERLARAFRERWGEPIDGWMKEFQGRGVPHFHLFHAVESEAGKAIAAGTRELRDDGREVTRGGFDFWIRDTWLKISGQLGDADARWFNARGITEFFETPSGAAAYVAKENAKREQKVLPEGYGDGIGRWWNLARRWRGRPRHFGDLDMRRWPWEEPCSRVWDSEALLCDCASSVQSAPDAIADPDLWLFLMGFTSRDPRANVEPCQTNPTSEHGQKIFSTPLML